jgi:excisionase family DNA binding protein
MTDILLTTHEAARELRLTTGRVRQLADAGRLPVQRTEAGWRLFRRADVEAYLAERAARRGHA